jgi:steroid delta-isomerase-like uncharacterized protein
MSIAENKTIARRFYEEAFNQQDFAVCDEHFAADFVLDFPAGPGTLHGLPGIKHAVTTFLSAFPDTSMTIEDMIAEGDKVVVHWTYRGTHHGELMGIPPTGQPIAFNGTDILRFADGKLVEIRVRGGMLVLLRQLGMGPPPGQPSA